MSSSDQALGWFFVCRNLFTGMLWLVLLSPQDCLMRCFLQIQNHVQIKHCDGFLRLRRLVQETFSLMKNSVQIKCFDGLTCLQMMFQQDADVEPDHVQMRHWIDLSCPEDCSLQITQFV